MLAQLAVAGGSGPAPLFRRTVASPADTLEIYAFKVEFAFEDPDNSLTTGRGTFDSDADTSRSHYSLDPQGARRTNAYWEKHLQYVADYFRAVSRGKLVVVGRVFPEQDRQAYTLNAPMISYNHTVRQSDQKVAQFDSVRVVDYMRFVRDAVRSADASADSPFKVAPPTSPHRHRAYMLIHAGASRLLDGGSLGNRYADTPGDLVDLYIDPPSFGYLRDVDSARTDTAGVLLQNGVVDTVSSMMVVSETASQDGLNWGINGVLVHQVARAIGLPPTYDATQGVSLLGWYDAMDFAGYNAANGFLPVFPSAWARVWMGWEQAVVMHPSSDGSPVEVALRAVSDTSAGGTRVVKIPLTSSEYLLVENRQRTARADGKLSVTTDHDGAILVPADSVERIFKDSLCTDYGRDCDLNRQKATGILLSAGSHDAGVPASGLVVWKVSDWLIDRTLRYGYVNATQEGGMARRYQGIQLVEADGSLTIGQEFRDPYGQPAYDYGSGADLLPHISWRTSGSLTTRDTVTAIEPYGYANTGSAANGRTHLVVRALLPDSGRAELTQASFSGDSIRTWSVRDIGLQADWRGLRTPGSLFPLRVAPASGMRNLTFAVHPDRPREQSVALLGDSGWLQARDARGLSLVALGDSLSYRAEYDSVKRLVDDPALNDSATFPLANLGAAQGRALGLASSADTLVTLHRSVGSSATSNLLIRSRLLPGSATATTNAASFARLTAPTTAALPPLIAESAAWSASFDSLMRWQLADLSPRTWRWPNGFHPHALAWVDDLDGTGTRLLLAVGDSAQLAALELDGSGTAVGAPRRLGSPLASSPAVMKAGRWRLATSDFDRDSVAEAFLVSDRGVALFVSLEDGTAEGTPRIYPRGQTGQGELSTLLYADTSAISVGDLDGNGHPDVVFHGHNCLLALDSRNELLPGFPYRYREQVEEGHLGRGFVAGEIGSAPLLADLTGDGLPEILSATPAGLLYAVDAQGKLLPSIGAPSTDLQSGALRAEGDWPLAVGTFPFDDTSATPWIQLAAAPADTLPGLELFALSHDFLFGWTLPRWCSSAPISRCAANQWLLEGGNPGRTLWFPAAGLDGSPAAERDEIRAFHLYPSPLRAPRGNLLIELGAPAARARVRFLDITGAVAWDRTFTDLPAGINRLQQQDMDHLGSDVYALLLEVEFASGKTLKRWSRAAVVR